MLKSTLEKFIARRVLLLIVLLSIADVMLIDQKWHVLAGLVLGGIFSLLRFGVMSFTLSKLLKTPGKNIAIKSGFKVILNLIVVVILLAASLIINQYFFAGAAAGVLLVPFIIFVNCITEGLGITHNNFE